MVGERRKKNRFKLHFSKLIWTTAAVVGETVKRAKQAKGGHGVVIRAGFIHCVQQISCCSQRISQGEKSGHRQRLSAGRLLCLLCRAGKVSLINLKMKTSFTIESNFCRISDLLGCWIWVWGLIWCPRPASHTFNLIQKLAKVNNTSKEVNTWGTSRGKKTE